MVATRRIQLAAEGGRALALLARPPWEAGVLSAAATRWNVRRKASPDGASLVPAWELELLRCKGAQAARGARP